MITKTKYEVGRAVCADFLRLKERELEPLSKEREKVLKELQKVEAKYRELGEQIAEAKKPARQAGLQLNIVSKILANRATDQEVDAYDEETLTLAVRAMDQALDTAEAEANA